MRDLPISPLPQVHLNTIQVRLFEAVARKYRNRSAALTDYVKNFPGTGMSTARARFNGTTSISYSHGMEVAAFYDLHDLDIWKEGWPETHSIAKVPALAPDMDAYLNMVVKDLEWLKKQPDILLHLAISELPFILLKKHRLLTGFSLYFSLCFESNHPAYSQYQFGDLFLKESQISSWLNRCKTALALYQEIPGVEYWSPRMFEAIVQKIKLVEKAGLFENEAMAAMLLDELTFLINDLENKARTGKKTIGPAAEGASVRLYNHDGFLTDTIMVAESTGRGPLFSYQERGVLYLQRFDEQIARQQQSRINNAGRLGGELGNIFAGRFFQQLRNSIG